MIFIDSFMLNGVLIGSKSFGYVGTGGSSIGPM